MADNNFIYDLDMLYKAAREGKHISRNNAKIYSLYYPIIFEYAGGVNRNFVIKKNEFTKYLYVRNGARVYFSDADVMNMILSLEKTSTVTELISAFKDLYRGNGVRHILYLNDMEYACRGLPIINDSQVLMNLQDIDMPFIDLWTLINLILTKDMYSNPLWPGKADFLKHTLVKYISLLQYYYFDNNIAKEYLNKVGYNTEGTLLDNFNSSSKTNENNKCFNEFEMFENSGLL